ncbi:MAG: hypothetical protein CM15mP112_01060 [Flavobacteriales bacterium]|nr:MAG: hypothetical protein CM15mP112_01060 [Flavobacteriales bacterium]
MFIINIVFVFSIEHLHATHAAGIDLTYECISTNQYKVTLRFYRECSGVNAPNTFGSDGGYLNISNGVGYNQNFSLGSITPFPVPVYPTISSSLHVHTQDHVVEGVQIKHKFILMKELLIYRMLEMIGPLLLQCMREIRK